MQGEFWKVRNEYQLKNLIAEIEKKFDELRNIQVQISDGRKRSLGQNDLKEVQYEYIAAQLGEPVNDVRREAKYLIGCRILCRDDPEFKEFCKVALSHLNHEQRLKAMDIVPVTRRMTKTQAREYIDGVYKHWADVVDWGGFEEEAA